ncbi:hypothetical protein, partial [Psychrobacter sp. 1Y4]|uniref:hypothetical protein n=1 Tax=Psychrobacter sp. 1Y4 TaxID=3453575 RepID=UPI003F4726ED
PDPVRAAITQELKDITTLLQADTVFESFTFHTHDLDTHVDELYDNYNAEQAIAKAIIDKQEQERAATEKQQLEEQKKEAEETARKAEATRREQAETAQKEQEKNEQRAADQNNIDKKAISDKGITENDPDDNSKIEKTDSEVANSESETSDNKNADSKTMSDQTHGLVNHNLKDINNNTSAAINLVLEDSELDPADQTLIRELENQIDDYLSEQMMLMSENLKSWLRAEMTQHFSEQNTSATTENAAKKNIH